MPTLRLTKRAIEAAEPKTNRYELFDDKLKGFGLRISPSGGKTFFIMFRDGDGGRSAKLKRHSFGAYPMLSIDEARTAAQQLLASHKLGADPATAKADRREAITVAALAGIFLSDYAVPKKKPRTAEFYRDILERLVIPKIGDIKADDLESRDLEKLHGQLSDHKSQANRVLAVVGSMFKFGMRLKYTARRPNPSLGIERYKEFGRVLYLSSEELERLGMAIREAETTGLPWAIDPTKAGAKHLGKDAASRRTVISPEAAAALRLLIFTGARLREILHLRWDEVDLERGALFLGDSKSGPKTLPLNAFAMDILETLYRGVNDHSGYVIPGALKLGPNGEIIHTYRKDLKRPWAVVSRHARLNGVRLHDLRHTFASIAAGNGVGLLAISKLLGHANVATTEKYAHLMMQKTKAASNVTGAEIARAMGEVLPMSPAPPARWPVSMPSFRRPPQRRAIRYGTAPRHRL